MKFVLPRSVGVVWGQRRVQGALQVSRALLQQHEPHLVLTHLKDASEGYMVVSLCRECWLKHLVSARQASLLAAPG